MVALRAIVILFSMWSAIDEARYTNGKCLSTMTVAITRQMLSIPLPRSLIALAMIAAQEAIAFGSVDPFNTTSQLPPRPQLASSADSSFSPCQALTANSILGVIDVVDQALCRNPKTVELWASARNQAALVGVATAPYLPSINASAGLTSSRSDGENSTQRNASLTLSWLLLDFGTRSANLENARQLLVAAASTLDATVQTVFLNALQGYYNVQAARAALDAAIQAEKAARESLTAAETRYRVGTATPADRHPHCWQ